MWSGEIIIRSTLEEFNNSATYIPGAIQTASKLCVEVDGVVCCNGPETGGKRIACESQTTCWIRLVMLEV